MKKSLILSAAVVILLSSCNHAPPETPAESAEPELAALRDQVAQQEEIIRRLEARIRALEAASKQGTPPKATRPPTQPSPTDLQSAIQTLESIRAATDDPVRIKALDAKLDELRAALEDAQ